MKTYRRVALAVPLLFLPLAALAQPAPPAAPAATATPGSSSTVTLSPFEVRTEKDEGYAASNTLSGTRLNSSLANIPASIQVLTNGATSIILPPLKKWIHAIEDDPELKNIKHIMVLHPQNITRAYQLQLSLALTQITNRVGE